MRRRCCTTWTFGATPRNTHCGTFVGERRLKNPPSLVEFSKNICIRNTRVSDEHFVESRVSGCLSQRTNFYAWLFHGQPKKCDASVFWLIPIGARNQHSNIGCVRTRCPHLLSVDNPFITITHRCSAYSCKVRTSTRFAVQQTHGYFVQK